jgi:DNA/RNA-binding domain of Phe-tRNA-synthetase-like protein
MKIYINKELWSKLPQFHVVAYALDVQVTSSDVIDSYLTDIEHVITEKYTLEDVLNIPRIKEARDGYKRLGKDPSRYRLAVESLFRRVVKGNQLYRINNVVDAGNAVSLQTMRSVCVADLNQIIGDVTIRIGNASDIYEGINRGILNVENIPVYQDDISAFGSTTSDTNRTAVNELTKKVLVMILCFSEHDIEQNIEILKEVFSKFAHTTTYTPIEIFRK